MSKCPYCGQEITPQVTIEYIKTISYPITVEGDTITPDFTTATDNGDEHAGKHFFFCPACNHTLFRDQIIEQKDTRKFKGNLLLRL